MNVATFLVALNSPKSYSLIINDRTNNQTIKMFYDGFCDMNYIPRELLNYYVYSIRIVPLCHFIRVILDIDKNYDDED